MQKLTINRGDTKLISVNATGTVFTGKTLYFTVKRSIHDDDEDKIFEIVVLPIAHASATQTNLTITESQSELLTIPDGKESATYIFGIILRDSENKEVSTRFGELVVYKRVRQNI